MALVTEAIKGSRCLLHARCRNRFSCRMFRCPQTATRLPRRAVRLAVRHFHRPGLAVARPPLCSAPRRHAAMVPAPGCRAALAACRTSRGCANRFIHSTGAQVGIAAAALCCCLVVTYALSCHCQFQSALTDLRCVLQERDNLKRVSYGSTGANGNAQWASPLSPSRRELPPRPPLSVNTRVSDPGIARVHSSYAGTAPPHEEEFLGGGNDDLLVRQAPGPVKLTEPGRTRVDVNSGIAHEFDGPLFKGKISVWLRGLPQANGGDVFEGKRRRSWVVVQGRFKERIATSECA